ncbi:hypothetical protein RhiTH_000721 [Rhizoctonia solani]
MTPPAPKRSRTAPKFHSGHLDPNRARKLKKEWIAHQKLKARYRAEKRRMGMTKVTAEDDGDEAGGSTGDDIAKADESDSHSDSPVNDSSAEVADTAAQSPVVDSSRARGARSRTTNSGRNTRNPANEVKSEQESPSLRELARDAYSPASLHTFKSHPLRGRPHGKNNSRTKTNPYPSRTDINAQKGGRGQPNMAKRMGVLLERIKRSTQ